MDMKMSSLADSRSAVWARSSTDDVSLSQLHKFWSGLSTAARRELLRIDKHALFEQVRKNLYCSRCHGLLVDGYAQIVSYGKSLQAGQHGYTNGSGSKDLSEVNSSGAHTSLQDDSREPSVHPWGGLAATRDSMLTVLDCFLDGTLVEVFESARARERERELLYPDACGGSGRGWISQGTGSYGGSGRGHGMKETCALHTARLSCEALVDFWSALGEETRHSLLRMKEEDFIERLMFRFDSKRFCRDCRRNVLREFKEMKELKRTRKEPRCTRWFCAADTAFRYEVSETTVQVDWRDCFSGDVGTVYQRFEWALGSGESKADILGFEDVGLSESVEVDGLELGSTAACYITVRGWKRDGRYSELSTKAHALKGQLCVHRRLIVGDGYVSITKGESMQRFFERAEETEEEEDDDAVDKDGNEIDGEVSRPQKHAKSPELARDFLLDAATVIFKEQVEKAFREGTARQNAHSIFVCLALSLLEDRVRVACKEITTLEKQNKLLEEEEDEKREEEERRERRKLKEKEKKLRRKEKLRGKGQEKQGCQSVVNSETATPNGSVSGVSVDNEEAEQGVADQEEESRSDVDSISARPASPDMADARSSADGLDCENGSESGLDFSSAYEIEDSLSQRDGNGAFIVERAKSSKRRLQGCQAQVFERNQSGQSKKENAESGVWTRNPARVAPAPPVDTFTNQDRATKNSNQRHDANNTSKRLDSWVRGNAHPPQRMEDLQHCACGGPQTNLRLKGNHRGIARVGSNEFPPSKVAGTVSLSLKGLHSNLIDALGYPDDQIDGSKEKAFAVPPAKRKGEMEQETVYSDPMDIVSQGHSRNSSGGDSSEEMETARNGFAAANGSFVHSLHGSGAPDKSAWVAHNQSGDALSQSASVATVDYTVSHGNNKVTSIRPAGRACPLGAVYHEKAGIATASADTPRNDLYGVGEVLDQGTSSRNSVGDVSISQSLTAGMTVPNVSSTIAKPLAPVGNDPLRQAVIELVSNRSSLEGNFNERGSVSLESAELNGATVMDTGESTQTVVVLESSDQKPVKSPLASAAASQGLATVGVDSSVPRVVQKTSSSQEVSSHGSIWPTLIPGVVATHGHPQPSFGYYQATGLWVAPQPRTGVFPLPQLGSFLIPPSHGFGQPMGGIPPVHPTAADCIQRGLVPSLSNGFTTLQLKDSIFLSRFGGGPASGSVSAPPDGQLLPSASGMETSPFSQGGPIVPGRTGAETTTSIPAMKKDIMRNSMVQADTSGFSLFHFNSPESVAQKETNASGISLLKENGSEHLSEVNRCGSLNGTSGREYSLFATAGEGLVFF